MKSFLCSFFRNEKTILQKVFYSVAFLSFFLMCLSILLFSNNKLHLLYHAFFILFASSIIVLSILKKSLRIKTLDIFGIVFILCVTVSKLLNPSSSFSTTPYSVFAIFIVCNHFITKSNTKYVLITIHIAFIVFLIAFLFFYRNSILALDFTSRLGTFFQNENTVGYYFVYGLVLCLWFSGRKSFHLFWLIPALLNLLMIIYTGSRSSLIIAALVFLIFLFYIFGKKRVWIFGIVVGIFIVLIILLFNLPAMSSLTNRIIKAISGDDSSTFERFMLLKEGLFMFVSKPLVGWGYNGMRSSSSGHLFAHNNFVQLLSDFGIIGFVVFETLVFTPLFIIIKTNKRDKPPYLLFLIMVLISILFIQFFYANYQLKFEYIFLSIAGELTFDKINTLKNKNNYCNSFYECYI